MNAPSEQARGLTAAALMALRDQRDGRTIWRRIEDELGMASDQARQELGVLLRIPTLSLDALSALEPVFSLMGFAKSVQRRCLIANDPAAPRACCA